MDIIKNNNSGIYRIRNIKNGKCYIGSTENFAKRHQAHKNSLERQKHHTFHLQRAWNKYGEGSFVFEVLEEIYFPASYNKVLTAELLEGREQYYLDTLLYANCNDNRFGKLGYNTNRLAGNQAGWHHSEQTKKKIGLANSISLKGKKQSKETKLKRGKSLTGYKRTQEEVEKSRLKRIGQKRTKEQRKTMSLAGKRRVEKERKLGILSKYKVIQFDLNDNFIKEWVSCREAETFYNKHGKVGDNIGCCARSKQKTAYGYVWKYVLNDRNKPV